jgi:predicted RNA-binding protein with RPS1 domain
MVEHGGKSFIAVFRAQASKPSGGEVHKPTEYAKQQYAAILNSTGNVLEETNEALKGATGTSQAGQSTQNHVSIGERPYDSRRKGRDDGTDGAGARDRGRDDDERQRSDSYKRREREADRDRQRDGSVNRHARDDRYGEGDRRRDRHGRENDLYRERSRDAGFRDRDRDRRRDRDSETNGPRNIYDYRGADANGTSRKDYGDASGRGRSGEASTGDRFSMHSSGVRDGRKGAVPDVPEVYAVYRGRVTNTTRHGAFVELQGFRGRVEGMAHVSNLSSHRVSDVGDVCKRGQEVWVKVLSIQEPKPGQMKQRIELSLRDVDQATGKDLLPCHDVSRSRPGSRSNSYNVHA